MRNLNCKRIRTLFHSQRHHESSIHWTFTLNQHFICWFVFHSQYWDWSLHLFCWLSGFNNEPELHTGQFPMDSYLSLRLVQTYHHNFNHLRGGCHSCFVGWLKSRTWWQHILATIISTLNLFTDQSREMTFPSTNWGQCCLIFSVLRRLFISSLWVHLSLIFLLINTFIHK